MLFNEFYNQILCESRENNPDTNFYAYGSKDLMEFRQKVLHDGKRSIGKSHEILWRPSPGDTIGGASSRKSEHFPKELDLNAFYKATTKPLKSEYESYFLNDGLSPCIELNVHEGPYAGKFNRACFYGIFPPNYILKNKLNPETKKTFNDLIDEL
jgi:hypothetical protein